MKKYITLIILFFPWIIRKRLYRKLFGYQISNSAYIGFSWIFPDELKLADNARIGSFTVCKNIKILDLGVNARLGSLNWITGFPILEGYTGHFSNELDRLPGLFMEQHSAITGRHIIDCTNTINIGAFSTVAGLRSQLLTHSIDIENSRQVSERIEIGKYCFIGTNSIVLKGSKVPDYSIFGSMSLINKKYEEGFSLYGGVPAKKIKNLSREYEYFSREKGYIL